MPNTAPKLTGANCVIPVVALCRKVGCPWSDLSLRQSGNDRDDSVSTSMRRPPELQSSIMRPGCSARSRSQSAYSPVMYLFSVMPVRFGPSAAAQ